MLIGLVGRLLDEALDYSDLPTPDQIIARALIAYRATFTVDEFTASEAEGLAEMICLDLEASGWSLSGICNREIFCLPAGGVESLFREFAGCEHCSHR